MNRGAILVTAGLVIVGNVILLVSLVGTVVNKHNSFQMPSTTEASINTSGVEAQIARLHKSSMTSDKFHWEIASIYEKSGNLMKQAAHCVIDPAFSATDDQAVVTWKCHDDNSAYLGQNVTLNMDGSLSVAVGGYYLAYSQILYHGEGTEELDYGRIIHSVLKQKDSELNESPTILMQNLQSTPTIRRGRQAYTTSSLGATFYLEANSRISVKSSIPRNIATSESPYSTYFGLFLV